MTDLLKIIITALLSGGIVQIYNAYLGRKQLTAGGDKTAAEAFKITLEILTEQIKNMKDAWESEKRDRNEIAKQKDEAFAKLIEKERLNDEYSRQIRELESKIDILSNKIAQLSLQIKEQESKKSVNN